MFHDYLAVSAVRDARRALIDLFVALDTKPEDRDPYMDEALAAFPYVNGGLFAVAFEARAGYNGLQWRILGRKRPFR